MAKSSALVQALKRELRARGITYARVAAQLGLSEASVKRLFAGDELSLARIDRICELLGVEFSDIVHSLDQGERRLARLTPEQEREFVAHPRLMLVALAVLSHWQLEDIVARYDMEVAECVRHLARLDRLNFIELLPRNRYRLRVSEAFTWIPDGPIQRLFKAQVHRDFFDTRFDGEQEFMVLASGAFAPGTRADLLVRLRRLAAEFSELRRRDASLPARERSAVTLLLAARRWEPAFLARYRRRRANPAPKSA